MIRGMIHLNRNVLCAIDIETTGDIPYFHDIIEISAVVLDSFCRPVEDVGPFYSQIAPMRVDNLQGYYKENKRKRIIGAMKTGIPPLDAQQLFIDWIGELNLPEGKKISPLGYNWPAKMPFIMEWLGGPHNYNYYIDYRYRDVLSNALFINDYYDWHISTIPYSKQDFAYLCSSSLIKIDRGRDTLSNAHYIAGIHAGMLRDRHMEYPLVDPRTVPDESEKILTMHED